MRMRSSRIMPTPGVPDFALDFAAPHSFHPVPSSSAEPLLISTIRPVSRLLLPMKSAVNSDSGLLYICCGVPCCSILPPLSNRIRSDIASASPWSCVTQSADNCMRTINSRSQGQPFQKRMHMPGMQRRPLAAASRARSRMGPLPTATGFSTRTCLPARRALAATSAWVSV